MKTLHVALAMTLVAAAACSDTDPNDVKFDGIKTKYDGKSGKKDTGPDLPPPPTLNACDFIITELMPAPKSSVEWLEIYNPTSAPKKLAGTTLVMWHKDSTKPDKVVIHPDSRTNSVPAKGRVLICGCDKTTGKPPAYLKNCYTPPDCKKIGMNNTPDTTKGYTVQLMAGTTKVHEVVYGKSNDIPKPKTGGSIRLAAEVKPADMCTKSKQAKYWCTDPEEKTYDTTGANAGTPGTANGDCCVYTPRLDDLRVNEAMTNAPGPEDQNEWVELYVADAPGPAGELDLYKMKLITNKDGVSGAPIKAVKTTDLCLRVKKGDYLLLAHPPKTDNTCRPKVADVDYTFSTSLSYTETAVAVLDSRTSKLVSKKVTIKSAKVGQSYYFDATLKTIPQYATTPQSASYKYCTYASSSTKSEIGYGTPGKANLPARK